MGIPVPNVTQPSMSRRSALHSSARGIAVLLALVAILTGANVLPHDFRVEAQDVLASHPVAGTWTFVNEEGEDAYPSVAIFHPDGSYIEILPWRTLLMGVWEPTGERTATVTQVLNEIYDEKLEQGQGRGALEIDASGNTMTWKGNFLVRLQDGSVVLSQEGAPSIGTRLQPAPMESLEELMETPVPFGATTPQAAATPAP